MADSSLHDKSVDNNKSILESITDENIMKSKVKQRAGKRQSVTKTLNKIEDSFEQLAKLDLKCFITKLNDLLSRIVVLDEEIEAFMLTNDNWTYDKYDENIAIYEEYTDKTSRMIKFLEGRIELL